MTSGDCGRTLFCRECLLRWSRTFPARHSPIGDALIGAHSVRQRCIVTAIDPDSGDKNLDVFRRIRTVFGGELALNCWVIQPGLLRIGDPVRIVDAPENPTHIGGWIVGAAYGHASDGEWAPPGRTHRTAN